MFGFNVEEDTNDLEFFVAACKGLLRSQVILWLLVQTKCVHKQLLLTLTG